MIQSVSNEEVRVLFVDILFQKLAESVGIEHKKASEFKEYFYDNSYDTDCIEIDIEDLDDYIICSEFRHDTMIHILIELIRSAKAM